jgi:hypothetical protein
VVPSGEGDTSTTVLLASGEGETSVVVLASGDGLVASTSTGMTGMTATTSGDGLTPASVAGEGLAAAASTAGEGLTVSEEVTLGLISIATGEAVGTTAESLVRPAAGAVRPTPGAATPAPGCAPGMSLSPPMPGWGVMPRLWLRASCRWGGWGQQQGKRVNDFPWQAVLQPVPKLENCCTQRIMLEVLSEHFNSVACSACHVLS